MTTPFPKKDYRIRIYAQNNSTVEKEFTTELKDPITYPNPEVDVIECSTGSLSTTFTVVNVNASVSTYLRDSDGRIRKRGRVIDISERLDDGPFEKIFTGRLVNVEAIDEGMSYKFSVSDERWIERSSEIFITTDSCNVLPPGPKTGQPTGGFLYGTVMVAQDNFINLRLGGGSPQSSAVPVISDRIVSLMQDDLNKDASRLSRTELLANGFFNHMRARLFDSSASFSGKNVGVLFFDTSPLTWFHDFDKVINRQLDGLDEIDIRDRLLPLGEQTFTVRYITLASTENLEASYSRGDIVPIQVNVDGHPVTDTTPLIVGSDIRVADHGGFEFNRGTHPIKIAKDIYQGKFSKDDAELPRINVASFDALITNDDFPRQTFRITDAEQNMASWLEENIFKPNRVAPFINVDGEVELRPVRLPEASEVTLAELQSFNETNLLSTPTWDGDFSESIPSVHFEWDFHKVASSRDDKEYVLDRVYDTEDRDKTIDSDTDNKLIGSIQQVRLDGFNVNDRVVTGNTPTRDPDADIDFPRAGGSITLQEWAEKVAHEFFRSYEDIFISGSFEATRETFNPKTEPGSLVRLDLDTFPNPEIPNGLGGTRIVLITRRSPRVVGVEYEYVDVGPDLQPLAPPEISMTATGFHSVEISVTHPDPRFVNVEVRIGEDDTWIPVAVFRSTPAIVEFTRAPSNTTIYARAKTVANRRISSEWTPIVSATTDQLPAPTELDATVIAATATLNWTNTLDNYRIQPIKEGEPYLPIFGTINKGHSTFVFDPLPLGFSNIGVRYTDKYGGVGATASIQVEVTDTDQLRRIRRISLLQSRIPDRPLEVPEHMSVGTGVEVGFRPREPKAFTEIQVATDLSFENIVVEHIVDPGRQATKISLPLSDTKYFFRAFHVKEGFNTSESSPIVSGYATKLVEQTGPDLFAGGIAFIRLAEFRHVKLFIDHGGDPDTDRAYYSISVNPENDEFPIISDDADESAAFPQVSGQEVPMQGMVDRFDMPLRALLEDPAPEDPEEPLLEVEVGDEIFMTTRFWSEDTGFGQITRDTFIVIDPSAEFKPIVTYEVERFRNAEDELFKRMSITILDRHERLIEENPVVGLTVFGSDDFDVEDLEPLTPLTEPAPDAEPDDRIWTYEMEVQLHPKHFSLFVLDVFWEDLEGNIRSVFDPSPYVLPVDLNDDANIFAVSESWDGIEVELLVIGDNDTDTLHAEESSDGSTGWGSVVEPTPGFATGDKFSDDRFGSFIIEAREDRKRFLRFYGRNEEGIRGPNFPYNISRASEGEGGALQISSVELIKPAGGTTQRGWWSIEMDIFIASIVKSLRFVLPDAWENVDLSGTYTFDKQGPLAFTHLIQDGSQDSESGNPLDVIDGDLPNTIEVRAYSQTGAMELITTRTVTIQPQGVIDAFAGLLLPEGEGWVGS